jgi:hypothetical protein
MVVLLATCATQPPPAPPQDTVVSTARGASVSRPPRPEIDPDLCRTTGIEFADPIHEIGCADEMTLVFCWGVELGVYDCGVLCQNDPNFDPRDDGYCGRETHPRRGDSIGCICCDHGEPGCPGGGPRPPSSVVKFSRWTPRRR